MLKCLSLLVGFLLKVEGSFSPSPKQAERSELWTYLG